MTERRIPRSPGITRRAFDGGPNPFADESAAPIQHSDNPLAPSVTEEVQPFQAVEYEQTQSDRSRRILLLGSIGCCFVGVSALIAVVVALSTSMWATELVYCWPADLLGLALCIPAWIMAKSDLRAIRAGAMDKEGSRRTQFGYWCGLLGTVCGALPFAAVLIAIVLSFIR